MSLLHRLRLYAHTLPHLKPWQVAGRVLARAKRAARLTRLPDAPASLRGERKGAAAFPQHEPWNARERLLAGRFRFLNRSRSLGWPPDWGAEGTSLLWRFNLHYFNYLHLLEPEEQVQLCRSWVQAHPPAAGAGWHPYPTALRITNWCKANLQDERLQRSLYRQAAYLYRNLETYVYGNHLLENARALVMAGRFFEGEGEAPRWLEKGLSIFREEASRQILPDGGHYERSPMYHALVLEGYLDALNVLPAGHAAGPPLAETARRMTDALAAMTHPDEGLALFNDATREIAPPPPTLLGYARRVLDHTPEPLLDLPETGYYVFSSDEAWLMVDAGPGGPGHLMAHAHADVFSYELSLEGHRFVVDTGVYEYAAGPMRDYVRSTRAHSTVEIDGTDQLECWDSFRVARRASPCDISVTRTAEQQAFRGAFDGYARLIGDDLTHRRTLAIDERARKIRVEDEVDGSGTHAAASRIHLHPEVTVELDDTRAVLRREDVTCIVELQAPAELETGWYCPAFGVRHERPVIALRREGSLPLRLAYTLQY